jgi:hypothetical protein
VGGNDRDPVAGPRVDQGLPYHRLADRDKISRPQGETGIPIRLGLSVGIYPLGLSTHGADKPKTRGQGTGREQQRRDLDDDQPKRLSDPSRARHSSPVNGL